MSNIYIAKGGDKMKHVIYRNNIDRPNRAIVVNENEICLTNVLPGSIVYFNKASQKYEVANNNECDFTTGGIYAGFLLTDKPI
jgi:hypothetical protein